MTTPDPRTTAQTSIRAHAARIASGLAGVPRIALLAAGSALPFLSAPAATLIGLGGNALAGWLVDWAKQRLEQAGVIDPETSLNDLARDLSRALTQNTDEAKG